MQLDLEHILARQLLEFLAEEPVDHLVSLVSGHLVGEEHPEPVSFVVVAAVQPRVVDASSPADVSYFAVASFVAVGLLPAEPSAPVDVTFLLVADAQEEEHRVDAFLDMLVAVLGEAFEDGLVVASAAFGDVLVVAFVAFEVVLLDLFAAAFGAALVVAFAACLEAGVASLEVVPVQEPA